jgi:hypothetical protein
MPDGIGPLEVASGPGGDATAAAPRSASTDASEGGRNADHGPHQVPSLTQEKYEEVVRRLTNGKSHLESSSDFPFGGLLVHLAGQAKDGFCVVDIFESTRRSSDSAKR